MPMSSGRSRIMRKIAYNYGLYQSLRVVWQTTTIHNDVIDPSSNKILTS